MSARNAVLVLGMHRSGTSTVSAALSSLGVYMGGSLSDPAADNPKGFWEEKEVVDFNEALLDGLGLKWDSLSLIPDAAWNGSCAEASLLAAADMLRRVYQDKSHWGFKDPRTCRTLPFWQAVLKHLAVRVKYVIVVRNPLSVSHSLATRNAMAPEKAHLLWLEHYLPAVLHTIDQKRIFLDYDALMGDPLQTMRRLGKFLGLADSSESESAAAQFAADFLVKSLRHSLYAEKDVFLDEAVNDLTRRAYENLLQYAQPDVSVSDDIVKQQWTRLQKRLEELSPIYRFADKLQLDLREQKEQLKEQAEESWAAQLRLSDWATQLKSQLETFQAENGKLVESMQQSRQQLAESTQHNRQLQSELAILKERIQAVDRSLVARNFERLSRYGYRGVLKKAIRKALPDRALWAIRYMKHRKALPGLERSLQRSLRRIVIAFPVIVWGFRWQRPQHLLSEIADAGYTVIYLALGVQPKGRPYMSVDDAGMDVCCSELREGVFKLWLHSFEQFNIYTDALGGNDLRNLHLGIASFLADIQPADITYMVQHPGWTDLAMAVRDEKGGAIVFDCMDDHSGFSTNTPHSLQAEEALMHGADLVVATSALLYQRAKGMNPNVVLVRNGTEFEHFHCLLPNGRLEGLARKPIIGYYGAIAEWFDSTLIAECAAKRPDWNFVLIGATTGCDDLQRLQQKDNIALLGEIPYPDLPGYVHYFDVCLIPFKLIPLTLATNPVKFYEYISSGKPVVSTPLPELEQYRDLCYLATGTTDFIAMIEQALDEKNKPDSEVVRRRVALAENSSWKSRAHEILRAIESVKQE